jgi:glutathione S-transferase
MVLFDSPVSGNCYKVRLLLSLLGRGYERVDVPVMSEEGRTADFFHRNPNGRIPLLILEDGSSLAESNAILFHLSRGTRFLPEGDLEQARVLQWMFFEQNHHEPNIASARYWVAIRREPDHPEAALAARRAGGIRALRVMEEHLGGREWFVGESCSVADLALYAYSHVADEGGFDLAPLPRVREWLERVRRVKGFVAMDG